ncbi:MAG: monovalent cation/H(+) antiporter subunit G [Deltaproteobacteria bacterium]|nr:monovalent cation/H(+) antiporter subunit G [Candidatus Tharpellaceae bacterium]
MVVRDVIAIAMILIGCFFFLTSAIGLLRFPDMFTRMHATGKCDTMAVLMIMTGLIVHHGINLDSFKLLLIVVFIYIANPTATHVLSRAAFRLGVQPWTKETKDKK